MQPPREPSMEDILASIKKVIAEEKELRSAIPPEADRPIGDDEDEDDVLELDETMTAVEDAEPEADLGPSLIEDSTADDSRARFAQLSDVAASAPSAAAGNPLEDMIRAMLRPVLKQWLDENLPRIVDEHVKREISRITGKPL